MKKINLLSISVMAISLLVNCGSTKQFTVTLDANGGSYFGYGNKISVVVNSGTKLLSLLKKTEKPMSANKDFAYYEYAKKDNAIDYDDRVTSDITLKANYFLSSTPKIDNLNNYDWKTIKNIAVTGNPHKWFSVGATKRIEINSEDYDIRIIGFNYDCTDPNHPNDSKVGITFEFVNTINNFVTHWNNKQGRDNSNNHDFINNSNLNDCLQPGGQVYDMMPADLMGFIKTVNKKVEIYDEDKFEWKVANYNTKLFPLSYDEFDNNNDDNYEYYGVNPQSKRTRSVKYWSRSPMHNGTFDVYAWAVSVNGELQITNICSFQGERAVAPAFCV